MKALLQLLKKHHQDYINYKKSNPNFIKISLSNFDYSLRCKKTKKNFFFTEFTSEFQR